MNELKTAFQWYQSDSEVDIVDPDGWRIGSIGEQYKLWFNTPMTQYDYLRRRNRSTIVPYMMRQHKSPYGSHDNYLLKDLTDSSDDSFLADDEGSSSSELIEIIYPEEVEKVEVECEDLNSPLDTQGCIIL